MVPSVSLAVRFLGGSSLTLADLKTLNLKPLTDNDQHSIKKQARKLTPYQRDLVLQVLKDWKEIYKSPPLIKRLKNIRYLFRQKHLPTRTPLLLVTNRITSSLKEEPNNIALVEGFITEVVPELIEVNDVYLTSNNAMIKLMYDRGVVVNTILNGVIRHRLTGIDRAKILNLLDQTINTAIKKAQNSCQQSFKGLRVGPAI